MLVLPSDERLNQSGHVAIESADSSIDGFTDEKAGQSAAHTVALEVDAPRFSDLYFSTI